MPWEPLHHIIWFSKQLCRVTWRQCMLWKCRLKEPGWFSLSLNGRGARKNNGLGIRNTRFPSSSIASHMTSAEAPSWVSCKVGTFLDPSSSSDFWVSYDLPMTYKIFLWPIKSYGALLSNPQDSYLYFFTWHNLNLIVIFSPLSKSELKLETKMKAYN